MTERAEGRVTGMRCPKCQSTNVDCVSTREAHVHVCLDCAFETIAKAVRR